MINVAGCCFVKLFFYYNCYNDFILYDYDNYDSLLFSYDKQVKVLKDKLKTKEPDESTDMTKVKEALLQLEKKGKELVKKQMDIEKKEKVSQLT